MNVRMKKTTVISIMAVLSLLICFVPTAEAVDVDIPDPGLEAAIRAALGKPTGTITDTDLEGLSSLHAHGRGITDLSGLEYCVNLSDLDLHSNNISDISALSGLTNLTELMLWDTNISDVSALSGLTNLTQLLLGFNNISDISALSGLTNLNYLWLWDNNISDIQPLVDNSGLGGGDFLELRLNPLSYEAINTDIPALQSRSVDVWFTPRMPKTLLKISGDGQSERKGFTLPEPFVVQVLDQDGDPFVGVPVTFTVTAGGGSLDIVDTTTDTEGFAQATLTLGPDAGTNTVEVAVAEISTPVTFNATGCEPTVEDVLDFIYVSVEDETLLGDGPAKSAEKRLCALVNMLEEAQRLIEEELIEEACEQLEDAYLRTDGESRPPDFVAGPAASELAALIQRLMDSM